RRSRPLSRRRPLHSLEPERTLPGARRCALLSQRRRRDSDHLSSEGHEGGASAIRREVAVMRRQYDFSKARRNPYAARLKQSVTIRWNLAPLQYLKDRPGRRGFPTKTLINLYLADCGAVGRKLDLKWRP